MNRPAAARRHDTSRWMWGLLMLAMVMAIWAHAHAVMRTLALSPGEDFAAVYTNARLLRQGADIAQMYADGTFVDYARALTHGAYAYQPLQYPPSAFWPIMPFTFVPYQLAYRCWVMGSLMAAWGAMWLIGRRFAPAPGRGAPVWLSVILLTAYFHPLLQDWFAGQAMSLVLLCHVLGLVSARRNHWSAGVWFALGNVCKPHLHLLWLFLALWKRWKICLVGLMATILLEGMTWWLVGAQTYYGYAALRAQDAQAGVLYSSIFSSSVTSVLARLLDLSHHADWVIPMLASVAVGAGVYGVWAGRLLWRCRAVAPLPWLLGYGLWMGSLLLWSPRTHEHHLVLLLIPLMGVWWTVLSRADRAWYLPGFLVAYGLLAAEYSTSRFPQLQAGLPALLTVGRTIGMLATIGWCAWLLRAMSRRTPRGSPG